MTKIKLSSADLGRLQFSDQQVLNDWLSETDFHDFEAGSLKEMVFWIKRRIDSGTYILNDIVARLLSETHDPKFFASAKDSLIKDIYAIITIYKSGFPNIDVQEKLFSEFALIANDDSNPRRRNIVEAIAARCDANALPLLEMIFSQLEPGAVVHGFFDTSSDPLSRAKRDAKLEFVKLLSEAIAKLRSHSQQMEELSQNLQLESIQEIEIERCVKHIKDARKVSLSDPMAATVLLRKGAEALAKRANKFCGVPGPKVEKATLTPLLDQLAPYEDLKFLRALLSTVAPVTNFAAHDQNSDCDVGITLEVFDSLAIVLELALTITASLSDPD